MQKILKTCTSSYEAIGGIASQEKINYFYWKWEIKNRKFAIKNMPIELLINQQKIE